MRLPRHSFSMFRALHRSFLTASVFLLIACGASTSLSDEPAEDAGARDMRVARDTAPFDGGLPDGIVVIDAAACGTCDDGLQCNGDEVCTIDGCVSLGNACDDGDECTADTCSEANGCTHTPTDRDGDSDGVTSCGGDCDDTNGSVFPGADELCDGVDNNCDGAIDEGVISECGDCRPGCQVLDVPREVGGAWAQSNTEFNGVDVGGDGSLRLTSTRMDRRFASIANGGDATLTKIDLTTGAQVAEFDSTLQGPNNGPSSRGALRDCNRTRKLSQPDRRRPEQHRLRRQPRILWAGDFDEGRGSRRRVRRPKRQRTHRHLA